MVVVARVGAGVFFFALSDSGARDVSPFDSEASPPVVLTLQPTTGPTSQPSPQPTKLPTTTPTHDSTGFVPFTRTNLQVFMELCEATLSDPDVFFFRSCMELALTLPTFSSALLKTMVQVLVWVLHVDLLFNKLIKLFVSARTET